MTHTLWRCLRTAAALISLAQLAGAGGLQFVDQTASRMSGALQLTSGDVEEKNYAWGDVDQDGDIDLVVARKTPFTTAGARANVLFLNEGGVLVDRTVDFATASDIAGDLGFLTPTCDRDIQLADLDGDSWIDIVTACQLSEGQPKWISHPRVYRNLSSVAGIWQGFRYEDARIPQLAGLAPSGAPHAPRFVEVAIGDVDVDGDLDLYFTDHDSGPPQTFDFNDRLLLNDGNGFTDATASAFVGLISASYPFAFPVSAYGIATAVADFDANGFPDLVKSTGLNPPQFVAIAYNDAAAPGVFSLFDVPYSQAAYHADAGDLNNDGLADLVVGDDGVDRYLLNQGVGASGIAAFTAYTFALGPGGFDDGFVGDIVISDLDADGFRDVLICDVDVDISGCSRRLHVYRNLANPPQVTLAEVGLQPWTPTGVHDVAVFDVDGDAWLDLVIGRCSGTQVWIGVPPSGLVFSYPVGLPPLIPCSGGGAVFQVQVDGFGGAVPVPGSLSFWLSVGGSPFAPQPVSVLSANNYEVSIPSDPALGLRRYYFEALYDGSQTALDPPGAPGQGVYHAFVADSVALTLDALEGSVAQWTVDTGPALTGGTWERAIPTGTLFGGAPVAPSEDASPGPSQNRAFVTQNGLPGGLAGASDIDGGWNDLISPRISVAGADARISWQCWFVCVETSPSEVDVLQVAISNDDGAIWLPVMTITGTAGWELRELLVSEYVVPTDQVRLRFSAADDPNNSLTEAGIDDFAVEVFACGPRSYVAFVRGDANADGTVDISDAVFTLSYLFGSGSSPSCLGAADLNDDGGVDVSDAVYVLAHLFVPAATPPPAPFPDCGADATPDFLGCAAFAPCP